MPPLPEISWVVPTILTGATEKKGCETMKKEETRKRNRIRIMVTALAIVVVASVLLLVLLPGNKGSDQVRKDNETKTEYQAEDGWTEYVYETKWQNESGKFYDTKEECLRNSVSHDCKEKKVLVDTIWHEAE